MDVRILRPPQLDAMREIANIGAGHAATAVSQMTVRSIMIDVPELHVLPLEQVNRLIGEPDTDPSSLQVVLRQVNVA
jgi:chemotaxis protein CheC